MNGEVVSGVGGVVAIRRSVPVAVTVVFDVLGVGFGLFGDHLVGVHLLLGAQPPLEPEEKRSRQARPHDRDDDQFEGGYRPGQEGKMAQHGHRVAPFNARFDPLRQAFRDLPPTGLETAAEPASRLHPARSVK